MISPSLSIDNPFSDDTRSLSREPVEKLNNAPKLDTAFSLESNGSMSLWNPFNHFKESYHSMNTFSQSQDTSANSHVSSLKNGNLSQSVESIHSTDSNEKLIMSQAFEKCSTIREISGRILHLKEKHHRILENNSLKIGAVKQQASALSRDNDLLKLQLGKLLEKFEHASHIQAETHKIRCRVRDFAKTLEEKQHELEKVRNEQTAKLAQLRNDVKSKAIAFESLKGKESSFRMHHQQISIPRSLIHNVEEEKSISIELRHSLKNLESRLSERASSVDERKSTYMANKSEIRSRIADFHKLKLKNESFEAFLAANGLEKQSSFSSVSARLGMQSSCNTFASSRSFSFDDLLCKFHKQSKEAQGMTQRMPCSMNAQEIAEISEKFTRSIQNSLSSMANSNERMGLPVPAIENYHVSILDADKIAWETPYAALDSATFLNDRSVYHESIWVIEDSPGKYHDVQSKSREFREANEDFCTNHSTAVQQISYDGHSDLTETKFCKTPPHQALSPISETNFLLPPTPHRLPSPIKDLDDFSVKFI